MAASLPCERHHRRCATYGFGGRDLDRDGRTDLAVLALSANSVASYFR